MNFIKNEEGMNGVKDLKKDLKSGVKDLQHGVKDLKVDAKKTVNSAKDDAKAKIAKLQEQTTGEDDKGLDPAKQTFTKKGDWSAMSADVWHDSLYFEGSYFFQLFQDTMSFILSRTKQHCGGAELCSLVEVGSGTGDVILGIASEYKQAVGIDINPEFNEYARNQMPKDALTKTRFITGSATELLYELDTHTPGVRSRPVVVACVNNTLGVFPDAIKPATFRQLKLLAGDTGIIVIGFWNGRCFGDALQHFYSNNPQLCGDIAGAELNFEKCTMKTTEGYCTKWTTKEEAKEVLTKFGFDIVEIVEVGRGVLCTCRGAKAVTEMAKPGMDRASS